MTGGEDARAALRTIGEQPDAAFDLPDAALLLSVFDRPGLDLAPYRSSVAEIARAVTVRAAEAKSADARRQAINAALFDDFGFEGDMQTYDDLRNADLAHVLDRRRGLPVALGILYIGAARAQGWDAMGLSFPGHFLIRLDAGGERLIVDPFAAGAARGAADLRDMLKVTAGLEAELTAAHYEPVEDRAILLRLQNNLKIRHLGAGRIEAALRVIEGMLLIAPEEPGLWQESGLLEARLGRLSAAAEAMETCVRLCRSEATRREAASLLRRIRERLN